MHGPRRVVEVRSLSAYPSPDMREMSRITSTVRGSIE